MDQSKTPMSKMEGAKAVPDSPALAKAIKQLQKSPNPKATHPEFTAKQAKEVTPEQL